MGIVVIFGWIIIVLGAFIMLIEAFRSGILWGLAFIFIPFASLVWLILHFDKGKKPFFMQLMGLVIVAVASMFT